MAYSCVRVLFEIGHEATIRNKKTPQGFTHDWELFVRGADNTDIHNFVDKVIFHLHESFHNPKRVVKDPPYVVRESGYAGFALPIDIYLKNSKDEPHKIRFRYQLTLQESGPPISNVNREKYVFSNPSEDFRRKLIKGGGVGVGAETSVNGPSEDKSLNSKIKQLPNQETSKLKSKPKEIVPKQEENDELNDSFSSIFGQPIKTSKLQLVQKGNTSKQPATALPSDSKQQASMKTATAKRAPSTSRKEKKECEKEKEKEKMNVAKSKKESSKEKKEIISKEQIKTKKEDTTTTTTKKEGSEEKLKLSEKEGKSEKKEQKERKHREKKEKNKENKKSKENSFDRLVSDVVVVKNSLAVKDDKRYLKPSPSAAADRDEAKSPLRGEGKTLPTVADLRSLAPAPVEYNESYSSEMGGAVPGSHEVSFESEKKEKHRHHKHKKEKKSKRDKEEKKRRKEDRVASPELGMPRAETPKKHKKPLNALFEELPEKTDTDESSLEVDLSRPPFPERTSPLMPRQEASSSPPEMMEVNNDSENRGKRSKKSKDSKKHKKKSKKDHRDVPPSLPPVENDENEPATAAMPAPQKFTSEYINKLKDLQHKIMSIDSNQDLQRVVQVIAETGQYEITAKTFDFDLCLLDERTVHRLTDLMSQFRTL